MYTVHSSWPEASCSRELLTAVTLLSLPKQGSCFEHCQHQRVLPGGWHGGAVQAGITSLDHESCVVVHGHCTASTG